MRELEPGAAELKRAWLSRAHRRPHAGGAPRGAVRGGMAATLPSAPGFGPLPDASLNQPWTA